MITYRVQPLVGEKSMCRQVDKIQFYTNSKYFLQCQLKRARACHLGKEQRSFVYSKKMEKDCVTVTLVVHLSVKVVNGRYDIILAWLRYLIAINFRWTVWNSSSSIQRNKIWLWTERFRTLWCTWYHSYIYVCVPVSKLDTLLCAYCAEHANIMLPISNKIILPPETEPNINRYTLSNTWIKTPRSDGLWNHNEII